MEAAVKEALDIQPIVTGDRSYGDVNEEIAKPVEVFPSKGWAIMFGMALAALTILLVGMTYLVTTGIGILGNNNPVFWGTFIVNFVFWIGIGHAGTLISAILFVFRQNWRTAINRSAEAMTIFAVMTAGLFPLLHTGRPWFAFWLFPYPNERLLPVNFRSPLVWDVFAISTYATVSIVFWYMGMVPDLASIRDRAKSKLRWNIYNILSLGWNGSNRTWSHWENMVMILAGLSAPLVLSVHTIVSFDFATSVIPGWHTTIFPPYFVAGAVFSGFGMVMTLLIIAREVMDMKQYITLKHLENMAKIILVTGMMVGYAYGSEFFIAWYSGNQTEAWTFVNRAFGPFGWSYWIMVSCNVISPQFFWFKRFRQSVPFMFVLSIFVNIGMWFERFVIVVTQHRDFLPSSWAYFTPTWADWAILIGSFGLFFTLFLLFIRVLPMISIAEVKSVMPRAGGHH